MLAVRTRPLGRPSPFDLPVALSILRALDAAPSVRRRGELTEDADRYVLTVPLPGLTREELTLQVTDTTLTLKGKRTLDVPEGFRSIHQERTPYEVSRKIRFATAIDADGVEAALVDGVLTITLPKSAAARARSITIR